MFQATTSEGSQRPQQSDSQRLNRSQSLGVLPKVSETDRPAPLVAMPRPPEVMPAHRVHDRGAARPTALRSVSDHRIVRKTESPLHKKAVDLVWSLGVHDHNVAEHIGQEVQSHLFVANPALRASTDARPRQQSQRDVAYLTGLMRGVMGHPIALIRSNALQLVAGYAKLLEAPDARQIVDVMCRALPSSHHARFDAVWCLDLIGGNRRMSAGDGVECLKVILRIAVESSDPAWQGVIADAQTHLARLTHAELSGLSVEVFGHLSVQAPASAGDSPAEGLLTLAAAHPSMRSRLLDLLPWDDPLSSPRGQVAQLRQFVGEDRPLATTTDALAWCEQLIRSAHLETRAASVLDAIAAKRCELAQASELPEPLVTQEQLVHAQHVPSHESADGGSVIEAGTGRTPYEPLTAPLLSRAQASGSRSETLLVVHHATKPLTPELPTTPGSPKSPSTLARFFARHFRSSSK